jgi:hypothetical protein
MKAAPINTGLKKKEYVNPKLVVFGNLGDITQTQGTKGALDGSTVKGHRHTTT